MNEIPVFNFFKHKYGEELLVDVNSIQYIKRGIVKHPIHRYSFYGIAFITRGNERLGINDRTINAKPGDIVVALPGDVWRWEQDTQLDGHVLIFEEIFLQSFFNDKRFLHKFAYLQRNRQSAFYECDNFLFDRMCNTLQQMTVEIHGTADSQRHTSLDDIDQHILRAMLYEVLTLLKRATPVTCQTDAGKLLPEKAQDTALERFIEPFVAMVDTHYATHRDISFYADQLFITPNYLNKLTKQLLGTNAKAYINNKVVSEIKNLLDYTSLTVTEIATQLNFQSSNYLIRYFRLHTGLTPLQYRQRNSQLMRDL